ncbi:MAG: serine/threonine protein kinase [Planctomycetota bacterium]|jgi:serine/threonine protein kinase
MQFLLATLLVLAAVIAFFMLIVPVMRGVIWFIGHVFGFIGRTIGDALRILGGALTSVIFVPLVLLNIVIGRWSAARHFGTAIQDEIAGMGYATYRLFIGNPAHLLGLNALTEGLEQRVPEAMAKAPGRDKPSKRSGSFDGYAIVGSIAAGGSGAKLYIAEPSEIKRAAFARRGLDVEQVVIKSFSVKEGSSLPQIVRESRALEAAKKIGLVLEHDLNEQRFYYVMPYVPGQDLGVVGRHLHDQDGNEGLKSQSIREAMEYTADLLETLEQYHRNGLWHKDVKPDNIIVHDGRAHLVDLGLVTPLRSAMTLTTHGTEYFRDPELVRMALKGVKVHEVNGVKFDIYAAGAVLYSIVENSFPAHGGLSHITKRCPEAVRWVIRRSMTEYDRRYSTANQMLSDLRAIIASPDMFSMKPAMLPSMKAGDGVDMPEVQVQEDVVAAAAAGTPRPPKAENASEFTPDSPEPSAHNEPPRRGERVDPKISVANWWTGRYTPSGKPKARMPMQPNAGVEAKVYGFGIGAAQEEIEEAVDEVSDMLSGFGVRPARAARVPRDRRAPAQEQLRNARRRASKARERMRHRRSVHCKNRFSREPNKGVGVAVFAAVFIVLAAVALKKDREGSHAMSSATVETTFVDTHAMSRTNTVMVNGKEYSTDDVESFVVELRDEYGEMVQQVYNSLPVSLQQRIDKIESQYPELIPVGVEPGDLDEATWIVLDDLGESASESARETFTAIVDALSVGGWDMIVRPSEPERVDLIASLRAELGTVQFGDPEAKELIGSWLRVHKNDVSGVLWFPSMTDKRELDYRFYALEGTGVGKADRIARRIAR